MFQLSWFNLSAAKKSQIQSLEKRTQRRLFLEGLETRNLMAGDIRAIDGSGNNLANPEWGTPGEQFIRKNGRLIIYVAVEALKELEFRFEQVAVERFYGRTEPGRDSLARLSRHITGLS